MEETVPNCAHNMKPSYQCNEQCDLYMLYIKRVNYAELMRYRKDKQIGKGGFHHNHIVVLPLHAGPGDLGGGPKMCFSDSRTGKFVIVNILRKFGEMSGWPSTALLSFSGILLKVALDSHGPCSCYFYLAGSSGHLE